MTTGLSPLRTQATTYGQFSTSVHSPKASARNGGGSSRWPLMVGVVSTALTAGFWMTLLHFTL